MKNQVVEVHFSCILQVSTHCQKISLFLLKTKVESDSDDEEETPEKSANIDKNKDNPIDDKMFPEVAFAVNKAILREVEEMEEKVFTASLQVKVSSIFFLNKKYCCLVDLLKRMKAKS